jgi:hypothetical protein
MPDLLNALREELARYPDLANEVVHGYGYGWWELSLAELDAMEYHRMAQGFCVFCGAPVKDPLPIPSLPHVLPLPFCPHTSHGEYWVRFFIFRECQPT